MKINTTWCKISGIYKITVTSNKKEYYYIGSSVNIYQRLHQHKSNLQRKSHKNPIMQNLYNKYGIEKFSCEILEECISNNLAIKEQEYINLTSPYINITKEVIRNTPAPETAEKIRKTLIKKHAEGLINHSGTEKISVDVYSLDGVFVETLDSCAEAGRKYNALTKVGQVCNGKRLSANGYQFRYAGQPFTPTKRGRNMTMSKYFNLKLHINETDQTILINNGVHGLYQYFSENLYKNPSYTYTINLAPVKSCELLENLETDNQQPSIIEI